MEVPDAIKKQLKMLRKSNSSANSWDYNSSRSTRTLWCWKYINNACCRRYRSNSWGPARAVLELAGLKDVRAKSLGSNNPRNMVNATIEGLNSLKTVEDIAKLRGKKLKNF